ncbi:ectonucleotide pyrophosphatase/phosphodiesterase [Qipengyuania sp. 6B39]|uniref:alkaline phosphatase family protein n=1 Tax=Qipengyuania proteolytica TaxID=2867239 RepID=UPI001C89E2AF|nr:ectonucleotide pyrophosphatase/phosphodiesterase [Qipengyuania proteolytica]MBX7496034.1 ectonucleotide pyrophosphatase/phosphodiesterase [Qipengyuania proteolytica]
MKTLAAALALSLATLAGGCATIPEAAPVAVIEQREPVTILVSIDGFRADYLDRGLTPTLSGLAAGGATGAMRPSFPSKTFPNHWTLVTGLVPDHNGITANKMEDPERPDEVFTMANVDPFWWADAKPVWVEAEEAGIRSAAMFWPGSAVPWGGTPQRYGPVDDGLLPSDWQAFSMQVSNTQRVNSVIDWLRRPAEIRPEFLTLYFDTVDSAGHSGGPDSEELNAALRDIDGHIASLLAGLATLGQPANLVIVADHGMAATSSERVIVLDEMADASLYRMVENGPYATFEATDGNTGAFEAAILGEHEHMDCWRKQEIPARLRYGTHRRIPSYLCLADVGWTITSSRPDAAWSGGTHGYDPAAPEMAALFIAHGPAFRAGATLAGFDNTAVAPLIRKLIGLPSATRADGDLEKLEGAFAE